MNRIYIGWDSREQDAYDVCVHSLRSRSAEQLHITPLRHRTLRAMGQFTRPWLIDSGGQFIDQRDGKPFSTEFAFTRFLVPHLARFDDFEGWAMFVDCDFLFQADVGELFKFARGHADNRHAVMCVKHEYAPAEGMKMDRMSQTRYRRKNWSSLMLFNVGHPSNAVLNTHNVNYQPGWWLHGLQWLEDDEIGALPATWNYLAGWSQGEAMPKAIHYTEGGPWMEGYEDCAFAAEWNAELADVRAGR